MRRVEMKKQYILGSLVFVIALVTVGFALLQSSLSINGTVSTKSNSWNIYFDNIELNQDSVSKTLPVISNRTALSFNVELDKPGDTYEFSVDAVNDGSIDAMINNITATNLTVEQAKLIDLSYTYEDGAPIEAKDYLKSSTRETIKVLVKYKEDITSTDLTNSNISLPISIAIEYVQADDTAKEREVVQQDINLYNLMKENADKTTTIDFSQHSGLSGTNGIYTTTLTEGNVPVYYYRGNVDNNVIFANYCWKIVRTTETGGVKIIYNGTPTSDGKCNKPNFTAGTEIAQSGTLYMYSSSAYYYGTSYTFNETTGLYSLAGTIKSGVWSESFASGVQNYYTCKYDVSTRACTTLYKITGYSSTSTATYSLIEATVNTDTETGTSAFNSTYNDNAYVGYMYGTTGASTYDATHTNTNDSTIKTYLEGTGANDGWFNTSGLKNYQDRLEDTVFCNDRSTVDGTTNNTAGSEYGTLGYGTNRTGYGALARSSSATTSPNPTYACQQANDKFTLSTETGNGKLRYPVGLITLDEAIFAGFNTRQSNGDYKDTNNYLYTGSAYWTFSPVYYYFYGDARLGVVNSPGYVDSNTASITYGVRPVVSLKSGTLVVGTGAPDNPYVVQ